MEMNDEEILTKEEHNEQLRDILIDLEHLWFKIARFDKKKQVTQYLEIIENFLENQIKEV